MIRADRALGRMAPKRCREKERDRLPSSMQIGAAGVDLEEACQRNPESQQDAHNAEREVVHLCVLPERQARLAARHHLEQDLSRGAIRFDRSSCDA